MTTHPVPVGTGRWLSDGLDETATDRPADLPRRIPGLVYAQLEERDWQALVESRREITLPDTRTQELWSSWTSAERDGFVTYVAGYAPGALLGYAALVDRRRLERTAERFAPGRGE